MHLIDSHCHIDFATFDDDRTTILSRCQQLGIHNIIIPAVTADKWPALHALCKQFPMLHPSIGLHPMFMSHHQPQHLEQLKQVAIESSAIAIGEIGLDFYSKDHNKQHQIDLVIAQLNIAISLNLPVILHVRKAHDVMFDLLKKHPVKSGVVHAFSGSLQQAQNYIKQGMSLGIGGACTYPRATRLRKTITELPLTSLVLETDAPDMPLCNQQGMRNSPEHILAIAKTVAELRQQTLDEIATVTTENCQRIFNL
jgi:TatD DNase family protein